MHLSLLSSRRISAFLLIFALLTTCLTSCKNDDDLGDLPKIQFNPETASGAAGSQVSTTLTITASEGVKKLLLHTGSAIPDTIASFNNEQSATYTFKFNIPSSASVNFNYYFTFSALDSYNRESPEVVFWVKVSGSPGKEIVDVSGEITGNAVWTADKVWRMQGLVKVINDAMLTIEPGTVVIGESMSKGTLIIQQGGKLIADGNEQHPIIFTSEEGPGNRLPGDWGGVIICGKGINNQGSNIELKSGFGVYHGGNIANNNSGILRHVRIEFAGKASGSNQELSSLTLASVGNETIIEHVQCSYGYKGSFEWIGGNVNARHLISYRCSENDFYMNFGYNGNIQFALALRDADMLIQSSSNGIVADNDGAGTQSAPLTAPVLANFTIIGAKKTQQTSVSSYYQHAAQLRRNSSVTIYNSFMTGYPVGLFIDDSKSGSSQQALNDNLQIRNLVLAGVEEWGDNNWGGNQYNSNGPLKQVNANVAPGFEIGNWFNTSSFKNQILPKWQDAGINPSLFGPEAPVLLPAPGILTTQASWSNTPKAGSFFEKVNFIGAFDAIDWTEVWSEWNPNIAEYHQ